MAESAAEAAEYAATKGKFWQMHDDLYEHQTELSIELLATLATKNELGAELLTEALASAADVSEASEKRLHRWRAERREWDANILH